MREGEVRERTQEKIFFVFAKKKNDSNNMMMMMMTVLSVSSFPAFSLPILFFCDPFIFTFYTFSFRFLFRYFNF
jgi:hypothetical protein